MVHYGLHTTSWPCQTVVLPGTFVVPISNAAPKRTVVAISGNGSFLYNGAVLETAVREGIPTTCILEVARRSAASKETIWPGSATSGASRGGSRRISLEGELPPVQFYRHDPAGTAELL